MRQIKSRDLGMDPFQIEVDLFKKLLKVDRREELVDLESKDLEVLEEALPIPFSMLASIRWYGSRKSFLKLYRALMLV